MSASLRATAAPIADLAQARFDRALADLHDADPAARVALDAESGLAVGLDVNVPMKLPPMASSLPGTDRAAAAAVLFLDRFGGLFGLPGWHVLEPRAASPLGRTTWFTFAARREREGDGEMLINVCADEDVVKHVRVER